MKARFIFRGDSNNIGWTSDLHLSDDGRPYAACTVRKNSAGQSTEQYGKDLRYRYAWWDGKSWQDQEIAYAGTRLYSNEYDYTGNICLDPDDLNQVYISTNADPVTGEPLISGADGKRHYEIFHGVTDNKGKNFSWEAITNNSWVDNLRPMVPKWNNDQGGQTRFSCSCIVPICARMVDSALPSPFGRGNLSQPKHLKSRRRLAS